MGQREVLCTDIQQEQYETVSIAEVWFSGKADANCREMLLLPYTQLHYHPETPINSIVSLYSPGFKGSLI